MKRSYHWLLIFALMAALSSCTDKDDTYLSGSGSGEAESEEYSGELATTLVPTEVVVGTSEEAEETPEASLAAVAAAPAAEYIPNELLAINFSYEPLRDGILINGSLSSRDDAVTARIKETMADFLEDDGDESTTPGIPEGELFIGYDGKIKTFTLDLNGYAIRKDRLPYLDTEDVKSTPTQLRLSLSYDAKNCVKAISLALYNERIGWSSPVAYGFDYTYGDNGQLASLEGNLYIAGVGTTIGAFRSEFSYAASSMTATHFRWTHVGSDYTYHRAYNSNNSKHYWNRNSSPVFDWRPRSVVTIGYDSQNRIKERTISQYYSLESDSYDIDEAGSKLTETPVQLIDEKTLQPMVDYYGNPIYAAGERGYNNMPTTAPQQIIRTVNTYDDDQLAMIEIFGRNYNDDRKDRPTPALVLNNRVSFGYNSYGLPVRIDVEDIEQRDGKDVVDQDDSSYATIKWETRQLPPPAQAIIAGLFGKAEGLFDTYFGLSCAGGPRGPIGPK